MSFCSRVAASDALLRSCSRHWVVVSVLLIFINFSANAAHSADAAAQPIASSANAPAPVIVVGFVGGFVRHDDVRHSEVQLAQKLQASHPQHLRVAMFQNWHREAAHQTILQWLDTDQDGHLTDEEKQLLKREARAFFQKGLSWQEDLLAQVRSMTSGCELTVSE